MPSNAKSRAFIFTRNNYVDTNFEDALECRYICYGKEVAPTTGTPHLQGYVYFVNARSLRAVRTLFSGCHVEIARGDAASNKVYCEKGGDFTERGDPPASQLEKGDAEKARWDNVWELAKRGAIEDIDADVRVRYYSTFKRIASDYMPAVPSLDGVCGIWIFGRSGSGKSTSVLNAFPLAYPKPCNIWWDGYQDEEIVLLDDIDKYHVSLGGLLKHWGDFKPFIAEIKGRSRKIRPKKFIVTSQYKIDEIWKDEATVEALERRFTYIEKIHGQDIILTL